MCNIHCNVIQDLLPLYADDVVSPESRELVQNHLACCPDCRQILSEIQTSIPIPLHTDDSTLRKMKKKQQRKNFCLTLFTVLWVALIIAIPAVMVYYNSIAGLSTEFGPENFIVTEYPDGQVELALTEDAQGAYVYYLYEINADDTTDLYLYIYGKDPVPQWLRRIISLRLFSNPLYPVYSIGPRYNFESDNYMLYANIGGLYLDGTISHVYYQTITVQEQTEFYQYYLHSGNLTSYQTPEKEDCTLVWSRTK